MQPFACGTAFAVSVLDSLMSTVETFDTACHLMLDVTKSFMACAMLPDSARACVNYCVSVLIATFWCRCICSHCMLVVCWCVFSYHFQCAFNTDPSPVIFHCLLIVLQTYFNLNLLLVTTLLHVTTVLHVTTLLLCRPT